MRVAAALAGLMLLGAAAAPAPVDVVSYRVVLQADFEQKLLFGAETIVFVAPPGQTRISFSPSAIEAVTPFLDGNIQEFRSEDGRLVIDFAASPQPVEHSLTVLMKVKPKRGISFSGDFAWSSYFTCDWMLCEQDAPGDKATIDLSFVKLPKGMTAVVSAPGGTASPYLFGFAVGRLRQATIGKGLTVFAPEASTADLSRLFAPTADMVAFFEEKAGAPLPYGRYDQVLVPGQEAQEASSFSLLGEETLAPILTDPTEDWAIAHELSHQWWGNAVTCADWSEFWLNEGFATFMTAAWKEKRWGRAAYDREMAIARKRWDASTAAGFDKPLAWKGEYPSLRVRRGIQYSKGALFLDALRTALGDAAFWKGVRLYTRGHLGGVVTSRDLQRAMEKASGKRLDNLFDRWVYG